MLYLLVLALIAAIQTQPETPVQNLYKQPGQTLTITGTPSNMQPLGWGGGGHTQERRFDPFKFADEHRQAYLTDTTCPDADEDGYICNHEETTP